MITIIALVLQVLISLVSPTHVDVVVIPEKPAYSPAVIEEQEWCEYHAIAYEECAAIFDALYASYTYKLSRNGRSMVNGKFVAMGAK